jgi:hypothetical protein
MFQILTLAGAAGGALFYAINFGFGPRGRNAAGILIAIAIGLALWLGGVAGAWILPEAWCTTFLLLWASSLQIGPEDLIWVRSAASVGLVVLLAQLFR